MIEPSAPKAGALPDCATPRRAEARRFPADLTQAESDARGNERQNVAGTGDGTPEIVPNLAVMPNTPTPSPEQAAGYSPTVRRIIGPTILLSGGEYFDFLDPASASFDIEDIAHGLSHICRFAGHCREFYSVAQHSVYVSQIVPPEHAFAGLMHDAAEAFVGDVAKPLKDLLPEYRVIEHAVEAALFERYGLTLPMHPAIKEADIVMLATEQLALMRNRDDWEYTRGRKPADIDIKPMPPVEAKAFFLDRFATLTRAKGEHHEG